MCRTLYNSIHSAPGAVYLFLGLFFIGLIAWSFVLSYFLEEGWKCVLGLFLAFSPAILIVSAFLSELTFSPKPWHDASYISSTLTYHVTYYILPSIIGYVAGFLVRHLREE